MKRFLSIKVFVFIYTIVLLAIPGFAKTLSDVDQLSYSKAAEELLPEKFTELIEALNTVLTKATLPDETKDLRKQIGLFRDYLDIFIYAYPAEKKSDPILEFREQIDIGYERVGGFKDLFDIQNTDSESAIYSEKEVHQKLNKILKWKKELLNNSAKVFKILGDSKKQLTKRDKKDLSQFYWGESELIPTNKISLLENLKNLVADMLQKSIDDYGSVVAIDNPAKELDLAEEFHNFRKRIRSVVKLADYDNKLLVKADVKDLELIKENVRQFGEIQDLLTKMNHNDIDIKDEIEIQWDQTIEWQKDNQFEKALKRILKTLKD